MAKIEVIQSDLFMVESLAVILPYDGMNRRPRFEGNLISAFRKLYEDCEEIPQGRGVPK